MAKAPFTPPPGIWKNDTDYSKEGLWIDGDKVRSRAGKVEKLGGATMLDDQGFDGLARKLHLWADTKGIERLALGTVEKLLTWYAGTFTDITPYRLSGDLTDPFSTTDTSKIVSVAHTGHGNTVGVVVNYSGATAVGGITINGEYTVVDVTDANTYTIEHSSAATSTAGPGGGTVAYNYEIAPGNQDQLYSAGYGAGPYGGGTYGTPRSAATLELGARTWTIDNYDEDLAAGHSDGNLYSYDLSAGGRAAIITNAPTNNKSMFVTAEKAIVAVGAGGLPMRLDWCDFDDKTIWTPDETNNAGTKKLAGGSKLIAGTRAGRTNLVWSDTDLFTMTFVPSDTIYAIDRVSGGSGLVSDRGMVEQGGVGYWMSHSSFWMYDGSPREIPNVEAVRDFVFKNLNRTQHQKCFAAWNEDFKEVSFWYPTASNMECDRFVMVNLEDFSWSIGTWDRTAWASKRAFGKPLATTPQNEIVQHEDGYDDLGEAMDSYILSAPIDLGDGDQLMDVNGIVPDFQDLTGPLLLYLFTKEYPNADEHQDGPLRITSLRGMIDFRTSGRQVGVKFRSNVLGGFYRFGRNRFDIQPAGNRR